MRRHGLQSDGQYTLVPVSAVESSTAAADSVVPKTDDLLADFLDWHQATFGIQVPQRQVGRLAKEIKRCLDNGYAQDAIKWGLCAWCSYFAEDPDRPPPTLDTIVYCMLMRTRGHLEHAQRARTAAGYSGTRRGTKVTSDEIAGRNAEVVRRFRKQQHGA